MLEVQALVTREQPDTGEQPVSFLAIELGQDKELAVDRAAPQVDHRGDGEGGGRPPVLRLPDHAPVGAVGVKGRGQWANAGTSCVRSKETGSAKGTQISSGPAPGGR